MAVFTAARAVTPDRQIAPVRIETHNGLIVSVRTVHSGDDPSTSVDLGDVTLVPGFIDLHAHGGGGAAFTDGPEAAATVLRTHLEHGTTSMMASLVTDTVDRLAEQVASLAPLWRTGELLGIHLEGPWISGLHAGAHDPHLLCDPRASDVNRLLSIAPGAVVMVTLAVERIGGAGALRSLVAAGVKVALGHSHATFEQAADAIQAGASIATHLFNAERAMDHREPGLVLALLQSPDVVVELIVDGAHLHDEIVRYVMDLAGGRVAFVSDAMAAAGAPDGQYRLGPAPVRVLDGIARTVGADGEVGPLAGSTLTLDRAVRRAVQTIGLPMCDVVRAVTLTPAQALGRTDIGRLELGCRADLVALDHDLRVASVVRGGVRVS